MKNTQPATAVRGTFGEFPSAKKLPGMALRVAITAILLWLAFRPANWSMIWVGLLRMHGAWFAAAIAALTLQVGIAAQRWRWIATGCGVAISLASALRYVFVGQFFNQALPATIGADGARIWYLGRGTGDWKSAFYSVVIDRAVGGLALGLLVIAILPGAFSKIQDSTGRLSILTQSINRAALWSGFPIRPPSSKGSPAHMG